ncbi:hypothetical protein Lgee_2234 [Legionella geestiana]|uniref:Uncharacterized protein n=1 Tax=Legionella geestiana TaxID=45065 RepID=A0A0W0TJW5_9GAMM|nr:hypothetical protein [Legionella geestiana]KTC95854.1 hypothetical protein Lgee_2234 [Legionella geestiana]QBS13267.1 hypothetical protein E4T54_11215 [Legionella geestiana]STX54208.1 SidC homolog [Legionella geestiana]
MSATEEDLKQTIDQLPAEILHKIAGLLPNEQTRSQFVLTCRLFHDSYTLSDRLFPILLTVVLSGEQHKAERILKQYPQLLLRKTNFTDPWTKEIFKDKSVFQYAVWAMDNQMYTMMLDCLPQNEQGEEIRKGLLEQAEAQKEHFSFQPLITALQTYVDNFEAWDWPHRRAHWCNIVGGAQRDLPAHVRHEYCHPTRKFASVPGFTDNVLPRSLRFYNWVTRSWLNWDRGTRGLGTDCAIFRGELPHAVASTSGVGGFTLDLAAVTALCEVRTADLISLRQRLQDPIQMAPIQKLDDASWAPTCVIS